VLRRAHSADFGRRLDTELGTDAVDRDDFGLNCDFLCMRRGVVAPAIAGLVVLVAGWVDWPEVGRWLRPRAGWLVLFGVAGGLLVTAVVRGLRIPGRVRTVRALSWWVVAVAAVLVAGVAWGATMWLLREADRANDRAAARVEAIKTGLSIGAGTGAVFALLLAVRRQWHQELSAAITELDAAEKRVTELYTKAVEQLGSDKAPVRLGGLYALERVAQNNPAQRQTIANVLCAYLRMPYALPSDPPDETADETLIKEYRERVQEREVRLTAQRLITQHLQTGPDPKQPFIMFWGPLNLDLTGAVLIDFSLTRCTTKTVSFRLAAFTGNANFRMAMFTGHADFRAAVFAGSANFNFATFEQEVPDEIVRFSSPPAGQTAATEQ
jgi:hypothetical protein